MAMLTSVSGFPEWLPEDQLVEQRLVEILRQKFELYGFTPLETRVIEPIHHLLMKGETDKEIYLLRRLQADPDETDKDLGLHFDLTVPVARYVVENRSKLVFPFRRYQIQKAWRGERPGLGRFREFTQADFDIISDSKITMLDDLEIIELLAEILQTLPIPKVRLLINNRKLLEGYYRGLEIENPTAVMRIVDKLEKIGPAGVLQQLVEDAGATPDQAHKCLQLGQIRTGDPKALIGQVHAAGVEHPLLEEGLEELVFVLEALQAAPEGFALADLSLVRGPDYYTGTIFEAKFAELPRYPSIAGGGRYDNLAATVSGGRLPGVGVTVGVSRILGVALHEGLLRASRKTTSCVLVALGSEEARTRSVKAARALRQRGIPCEIYPTGDKYGKQIRYAAKKGIPYVWFPAENAGGAEQVADMVADQVRDIRSGVQAEADVETWTPPENDRRMQIGWDEEAYQRIIHNPIYFGKPTAER
jgi:histidyl-tRNA synthetase